MDPVTTTAAVSNAAHSLSPLALFMHADLVGKAVIISLILASVWCWAVIINKVLLLRRLKTRSAQFENAFWNCKSVEDLYHRLRNNVKDPQAAIFCAAMQEWQKTPSVPAFASASPMGSSVEQRMARAMNATLAREMENIEKSMTLLATIGSTAPFVGLFGTVWGIMRSFSAIATAKNTSLAVVAPGIAEALFATAIGLIAAIPAVVAYNKLNTEINRYHGRLEAFIDEFLSLVSRQLEEAA